MRGANTHTHTHTHTKARPMSTSPAPRDLLAALAPLVEPGASVQVPPAFCADAVRDGVTLRLTLPTTYALPLDAAAPSATLRDLYRGALAARTSHGARPAWLDDLISPAALLAQLPLTLRGGAWLSRRAPTVCLERACAALESLGEPSTGELARVAPCGCSWRYGDLLTPARVVEAPAGAWRVVEASGAPAGEAVELLAGLLVARAFADVLGESEGESEGASASAGEVAP